MIGEYAGQGGFSIEFHNESALLACRDAVLARPYTVDNAGSQVTIQHSPQPIVLTLGRDGRLTGSGAIQVAGRVVVGMSSDNQVVYAPKTDNCSLGTLTSGSNESADTSTSTTTSTAPTPAGPRNTSTPTNATDSGRSAVLSVMTGFAPPSPLAGRPVVLLKESLEDSLRRNPSFQGPPGSSAKVSPVAIWGWACSIGPRGAQLCESGGIAMGRSRVSDARIDPNSKAIFPGVPAGTYYLVTQTVHNNQPFVWNLRINLKPGANSVTLDQRNAVPVN